MPSFAMLCYITLYVPHHVGAYYAMLGNAELEPSRNISVAVIVLACCFHVLVGQVFGTTRHVCSFGAIAEHYP